MNLDTQLTAGSLVHAVRCALYGLPLLAATHIAPALAVEQPDMGDAGGRAKTLEVVEVVGEKEEYRVTNTTTATKTNTPLVDVPQSITVISEKLIRDQSMQNMGDVVRYVPGVQMAQGEGHRDAPILRGNTSTADFFINGMRDDVQYYRDLYNVEKVEVLKGPSGMIFGRGGSGGLINRVTKQANWHDSSNLNLNLGSWDGRRITGDFNHGINDTAAFRVTGMYENSDTFRNFGHLERWAINPTMTFRLGENSTWALGYEHVEDDRVTDRGIPSLLPVEGSPLPIDSSTFFGNPDLSPTWARIDALTSSFTHEFGNGAKLTNQTRIADYDKFYQNVFPGAYTAASQRVSVSGYSNLTARKNYLNQTDLTFSAETGSVSHEILVGAEFGRQETDNFRQTAYFLDVGPNATSHFVTVQNPIYTGNVEFRQSASDADNHSVAKNAAVYIQDQIEFSPQWKAVLGVRFDRFEADVLNNRNGIRLTSADNLLSPRAGVIFKPQEDVSLYASYSIAYVPRAGEQLASLTATNRNLEPEKFRNVELGAKWDINDKVSATAAVYRLNRTNVAIADPLNPPQLMLVDGQEVNGVELGITGNITDAWQIMAGYAHQNSEVKTPNANNGNELGQVPKNSISFWNRYDFNSQWGVGLGAVHQDEVFVSTDNAVTLPSFTRVDAAVFYTINDNIKIQLNVENLLDENYYSSAHNNNNIMPGSPRAVRLGVDLSF